MRRPPQEGQKPRPLHEKATSRSVAQASQRTRTKPWARIPQPRNARSSRSTNLGAGRSRARACARSPRARPAPRRRGRSPRGGGGRRGARARRLAPLAGRAAESVRRPGTAPLPASCRVRRRPTVRLEARGSTNVALGSRVRERQTSRDARSRAGRCRARGRLGSQSSSGVSSVALSCRLGCSSASSARAQASGRAFLALQEGLETQPRGGRS